jgi:hypothetical protein
MEQLRGGTSAADNARPGHPHAYERYGLADGALLIVRYDNVHDDHGTPRENDLVAAATVVRFDDLRDQIPTDAYDAVRAVHLSPSLDDHNPLSLVRAVNALHPLGKDKILAALSAYVRLAVALPRDNSAPNDPDRAWRYDLDPQRVLLLTRLLFVGNDGHPDTPPIATGQPDPHVAPDSEDWPLFPLALQDDLPFFLAPSYFPADQPQPPADAIEFCRHHGSLRPTPLAPRTSPQLAAEKLLESPAWKRLFTQRDDNRPRQAIRTQAVRSVTGTPFRSSADDCACMPRYLANSLWTAYLQDPALANLHWDPIPQKFTAPR